MSRKHLSIVTLPMLALLSACGGGDEITTTNTGNIVLNDAQANYSFENDAVLNTEAADMNAMDAEGMNAADANMMQPMNAM